MKPAFSISSPDFTFRYVGKKEAAQVIGFSGRTLSRYSRHQLAFPPIRRIGKDPKWFLQGLLDWMEGTTTPVPPGFSIYYVRRQDASRVLGISLSNLDRLSKNDPTFPIKRKVGQSPTWLYQDLLDWMEQRPS